MKKFLILCALAGTAFGQGSRYDNNVFTSSNNVPPGSNAPLMSVPYAKVSVCAVPATGTPCTNYAAIYSDIAMTQPITQPFTADIQGRYGFFAAAGTYSYTACKGANCATGVITVAGAGGGTPGGADTQVQLNSAGAFAGDPNVTINTTTHLLKTNAASGQAVDYADPGASTSSFPAHRPYRFHTSSSKTISGNDYFTSVDYGQLIASGSSNFLSTEIGLTCANSGCDQFQNGAITNNAYEAHSPIQANVHNNQFYCFGQGDCIDRTSITGYAGIGRLTDERAGVRRAIFPTSLRVYGTLASISTADANGEIPIQITNGTGGVPNAAVERTAPLLDIDKGVSLGDITRIDKYPADTRFYRATLATPIAGGLVSTFTTLAANVDNGIYTGCPATQSGSYPGSQQPFVSGASGLTNLTKNYCYTVASTTGMSAGTLLRIASNSVNTEDTVIQSVVDGTHFIANAKEPHVSGELVAFNGYTGYAGSFNADVRPVGTECNLNEQCNTVPLYVAHYLMGCPTTTTCIFQAPAAEGGFNSYAFNSNTVYVAAAGTAVVTGGIVQSITLTNVGNYNTGNTIAGLQQNLPYPTITVPGCSVQPSLPTTTPYAGGVFGVAVNTTALPGGTGCTNGTVALNIQSTFANPMTIFPAGIPYRVVKVVGGNVVLNANGDPDPSTGYMKMEPLVSAFAVGDHVIGATWTNQNNADLDISKRFLGLRGANTGPKREFQTGGQSQGQASWSFINPDRTSLFYSDAAHNWSPTGVGYGYVDAPSFAEVTGGYGNTFNIHSPPQNSVYFPLVNTGAAILNLDCIAPAGTPQDLPCLSGRLANYRVFNQNLAANGGVDSSWGVSPKTGVWNFYTPEVDFSGTIRVLGGLQLNTLNSVAGNDLSIIQAATQRLNLGQQTNGYNLYARGDNGYLQFNHLNLVGIGGVAASQCLATDASTQLISQVCGTGTGSPSVGAAGAVQSAGVTAGTFADGGCTVTSGVMLCTSYGTNGSANGADSWTWVGTSAAAPALHSWQISPAVDLTTSWSFSPAAAPATGYWFGTNTAGVVQQSIQPTATAFTALYESVATNLGDVVYGGGAGAPTRLAGPTTNNSYVLTENVVASTQTAPTWSVLSAGLLVGPASVTVGVTAIAANSCTAAATVTMTGVVTTTSFTWTPNADVSGVTGWGAIGGLVVIPWPTANTLNYKVCNQTAASITPSASVTFNVGAR